MTDLTVVEFPSNSLADIPTTLESCAETIRKGDWGDVVCGAAVFVTESGEIRVCGWGRIEDEFKTMGVLNAGASWLSHHVVMRRD